VDQQGEAIEKHVLILWLGLNIIVTGTMILLLPLFLLFRRSLRLAVARGRTCRGNVAKSLKYAAGATVANMAWLYLIIYAGHHVSIWLKKGA
jgi:hypothetical protein